jgi:hypothetical protein
MSTSTSTHYLDAVTPTAWEWDETLYRGSAAYYAQGRLPYPEAMADALRDECGLNGCGRLLDVGCGPGSAALLLAPLFEQVVGIDADEEMIAEARREATRRGVSNARWVRMRAEALPDRLGVFRMATFAQSFHWMDRPRVARAVFGMLEPGGAWVHVNATTHQGVQSDERMPAPPPPREQIEELVHGYLGPVRRAGKTGLPTGTPAGEDEVMNAAGYLGPRRINVPRAELFERSENDIVASVYSLSWAAPHLFGQHREQFEAELRHLLRATSPDGRFCELARDIELVMWTRANASPP